MDCSHSTISSHIKGKHLSYEERVLIQIRLKNNYPIPAIAREICCSPSTVANEIARGSVALYNGHVTRYKASAGQKVCCVKYKYPTHSILLRASFAFFFS